MNNLVYPYSQQAERAVLGTVLLEPDNVHYCTSVLSEADFFEPANKYVFLALKSLGEQRKPVDINTVSDELVNQHHLQEAGGIVYLTELVESVIPGNIEYYVEILKDKTNLRALAAWLEKTVDNFDKDSTLDIHKYLSDLENEVLQITRNRAVSDFRNLSDVVNDYTTQMRSTSGAAFKPGLDTGYKALTEKILGWRKGELIVLGARPGMGKTALALNFALKVGQKENKPVAFFSLEMSAQQLVQRLISCCGRIDGNKVQMMQFSRDDYLGLEKATKDLANLSLYIDDTPGLKLEDFIAKARKLKKENPELCMIFVDYLQIIEVSQNKNESRERAVAKVVTSCKNLARELDIPIMVLAQLNRNNQSKNTSGEEDGRAYKDIKPSKSDLRESGQIEQDADMILFIYRKEYYNTREDTTKPQKVEIIIDKNRNGNVGTVELVYTPSLSRFEAMRYEPKQDDEL